MIQRVVELILRTAALMEAEGRALKRSSLEVIGIGLTWALATALAFAGLMALFTGLYLILSQVLPPWCACALVGAVLLALAAVIGRLLWRYYERQTSNYRDG